MSIVGFTYNNIHSSTFEGLYLKTINNQLIPSKRSQEISVMGRDGSYSFEDGYDNKVIEYQCQLFEGNIFIRRQKIRELTEWLSQLGDLVLDYENDKKYKVTKIVNDISLNLNNIFDEFNIIFTVSPIQKAVFENDKLTWNDANFSWYSANIPWMGNVVEYTATGSKTLTIVNNGNYKALPIIILTGTVSNITLSANGKSFTYSSLSGTVKVDCENMMVYSGDPKVNKMSYFNGDFIELLKGSNTINVTGSITNVNIRFDFRNSYI